MVLMLYVVIELIEDDCLIFLVVMLFNVFCLYWGDMVDDFEELVW